MILRYLTHMMVVVYIITHKQLTLESIVYNTQLTHCISSVKSIKYGT